MYMANKKQNKDAVTLSDKDGNYFYVKNGKGSITIYLHLATENKKRELGVVNTNTGVFCIRRNPEKHIFLQNFSYGFNEYVIKTAQRFTHIHLIEDGGRQWLFPKDYVTEKGSYLHFKNEGYERQLFVKISDLTPFLIKTI